MRTTARRRRHGLPSTQVGPTGRHCHPTVDRGRPPGGQTGRRGRTDGHTRGSLPNPWRGRLDVPNGGGQGARHPGHHPALPVRRLFAGRTGGRRRRRPVLGARNRPFSGEGVDIIAKFVEQRIDVSHPAWWAEPEAVEAIIDYHYPDGRHRDDFAVARWRLQVIAEAGFGWRVRSQQEDEERAMRNLRVAARGGKNNGIR